jgi:uncharacterized membrane protein
MGQENEQILDSLKRLEERISRLEVYLNIGPRNELKTPAPPSIDLPIASESEEQLEEKLGRDWFAKIGIVALAIGIVFLLTFPYQNLPSYLPSVAGYVLVAGLYMFSHYWRTSYSQIARYLMGGAHLLLFFSTLRLVYYCPAPVVSSTVLIILLSMTIAINLIVSVSQRSTGLMSINLFLGYLTALLEGEPWFVLIVVTLISLVGVMYSVRYEKYLLLFFIVIFANLTHALWSISNPLLGNKVQLAEMTQLGMLCILGYLSMVAVGDLIQRKNRPEDFSSVVLGIMNACFPYLLFSLLLFAGYQQWMTLWQLAASIVFLFLSVVSWIKERRKYSTFIYMMFSSIALSIAIVKYFAIPEAFIWLCWQSVLVISIAIWFHSRLMVVGNFFMYLIVFVAYLVSDTTMSAVSVSFGVVALLSARILNWQKDRLELRTEMMRNAYLVSALLFLPYAFSHIMPVGLVSLSWLGIALFYYVASRLLHLRKYRWMALLTMLLTILRVSIVDLVGFDPILRIVSFLVLGSALLGISMYYSRHKSNGEINPVP